MTLSDDSKHIRMTQCDETNPRLKWSWRRKPLNEVNPAAKA